jgi:hypothetical protein
MWLLMGSQGEVPSNLRGDVGKNDANRMANEIREWIQKYKTATKYSKEILKYLDVKEAQGRLNFLMNYSVHLQDIMVDTLLARLKTEKKIKVEVPEKKQHAFA